MRFSSLLILCAFVSLREIPPLPLRGEDTKPWPQGLGAVGEGLDGEGSAPTPPLHFV